MEAPIKQRFEDNVTRWARYCPHGATKMLLLSSPKIDFCHAENGELNLKRLDREGFFYHSTVNPTLEAKQWFSQLPLRNVQALYVYGLGLGYYYDAAWEWLRQNPERSLVIFEDDLEVVSKFFETKKARDLLYDRQVLLYYTRIEDDPYIHLDPFISLFSTCDFFMSQLAAYEKHEPQRTAELKARIAFFSNLNRSQTAEYGSYGLVFLSNFYRNILHLSEANFANGLFGKFAGVPAIICGAGPSLEKNIDLVAQLRNRALILSGSTGLNALQTRNITPHLAVGIDPNPEQFTRMVIMNFFETPFIYRNRFNHESFRMLHNPKLFNTGSGGYLISDWMEDKLGISRQFLDEGCNVLNFCLSLAYVMRCNPIICVGMDLAYSKGQPYTSGMVSHAIHGRVGSFRTKSFQEELLIKHDVNGEQVYTLMKWITESLWYSKFSRTHPDFQLINATEGGIGFPDIPNLTLAEASEKYLKNQYDIETLLHGEIQNSPLPKDVNKKTISQILISFSDSLQRCWEKYQQLFLIFDGAIKSNWFDPEFNYKSFYIEAAEIEGVLQKEEGYAHLLAVFNDAFLRARGYELHRLMNDEGTVPPKEIAFHRMKIDYLRYNFLKQAALMNSAMIRDVVHDFEKTQEKISHFPPPVKQEVTLTPIIQELPEGSTFKESYYPEGMKKAVQAYTENGDLHGPSVYYSKDGKILAESWFAHGRQEGEKLTYYENGFPHSRQFFKQGVKEGIQEYFYVEGNIRSSIPYVKGLMHGKVMLYHPSGILAREIEFEKGKRNGFDRIWDERGNLKIEAEFHLDAPKGIARQWYSDGVLAKEVVYEPDSEKYTIRQWNENGIPTDLERKVNEEYFDLVTKETTRLTDMLSEVYTSFAKAAPLLQSSLDSKQDINEELKELEKEMENLRALSKELHLESGVDADSPKEAIWKSSSAKRAMEKKLEEINEQMSGDLNKIRSGIRSMIKAVINKQHDEKDLPP